MSDRNVSGTLGVETGIRIGTPPNEVLLQAGGSSSNPQLLIGNSTTPAVATSAASFGPPMSSGKWYTPAGTAGFTASAAGFSDQRMILVPIQFGKACTINGAAIRVTIVGNAGAVCRLGLYSDVDGQPSALVADWGTVPGDAVAVPTLTPSTPVQAGWYWQALAFQSSVTTRPTISVYQNSPASNRVGDASAGTAGGLNGYFKDSVSGALPPSVVNDGGVALLQTPVVWLKAA